MTEPAAPNSSVTLVPEPMPAPVVNPSPHDSTATYLSLGDSYTIGESVPEADRWSMQLVDMLQIAGIQVAKPDIIAQTGWTTAELASAIKSSGNTKKYRMVSLLIGVNNQYRGQSLETYRTELKALLQTAITFADGQPSRVFVLSIPDWGVTPAGASRDRQQVAREIDAFNMVAADECTKAKVTFLDITPLSRTALTDASLVADDQLHFSGKMYRLWAEIALPTAREIMK
ncbi:MAG: SGNH/GDSL hydrolase family protein, partial [Bacteroidota bacterium]